MARLPPANQVAECAAVFGEAMFADDGVSYYLSTQIRIVGSSIKPELVAGK